MPKPIELHYWPTPNGWKVAIALEEMGLPYEVRFVNISAGEQFRPEFLAVSPNNRMPAIVDPEGPGGGGGGGEPVSVFESGAILQYLARKAGRFYGGDERARIAVDEWLFWQMGGLGPMAGQAHHFRQYAPAMLADSRLTAYGASRYTNEVHRLYGVVDRRLEGRDFVAGDYSIADMAIWPWIVPWRMQGIDLDEFGRLKAWFARVEGREAVQRGFKLGEEKRRPLPSSGKEAQDARQALFGQRAR